MNISLDGIAASYFEIIGGRTNGFLVSMASIFLAFLFHSWISRFQNLVWTWVQCRQKKQPVIEMFTKLGWREYIAAESRGLLIACKKYGVFFKRPKLIKPLPDGVPCFSYYEGSALPVSYEQFYKFSLHHDLSNPEELLSLLTEAGMIKDKKTVTAEDVVKLAQASPIDFACIDEYIAESKSPRDIETSINNEVVIARKEAQRGFDPQMFIYVGFGLILVVVAYNMMQGGNVSKITEAVRMGMASIPAPIVNVTTQGVNQAIVV